jgi:DNA-binding transcriptional MerR regulator
MSDGAGIEAAGLRRPQKSDAAFRTISEVSEDLDVPQHVLRFWESRFQTIRPLKRGGGRRYYRPEDVQLLRRIRDLLYKDGYTIRGVQKLLREQTRGNALAALDEGEPAPPPVPATRTVPAAQATLPLAPAMPERPAPAPQPVQGPASVAAQPAVGITGARRALIETLLTEIDELRKQLAEAVKKSDK